VHTITDSSGIERYRYVCRWLARTRVEKLVGISVSGLCISASAVVIVYDAINDRAAIDLHHAPIYTRTSVARSDRR
jgi:hypothetical protein